MAGNRQQIILGAAVVVLGVGTWWLTQSPDIADHQGETRDAVSDNGDRAPGPGIRPMSQRRGAGDESEASGADKARPPGFRKPDREGMEALTGVLGGGFGFDGEAAERDEETYPRPATIEEAREMFADARAAVEKELTTDGEIAENRKRELRHRSNLALSDLQDHLDLESPEGKTELNAARRSTRTSMIDLGPVSLDRRGGAAGARGAPATEG